MKTSEAEMLSQTKYAVDKLKLAGFARHEFRVNVERHYCGKHPETGRAMYEYGNARIILKCNKNRQFEKVPAMLAAGLGVELYTYTHDGQSTVSYPNITDDYKKQGKLIVLHDDLRDCNGFMIKEVI